MVCIMSPAKPKIDQVDEVMDDEEIVIDDDDSSPEDSAPENTDQDDNLKIEALFEGSLIDSKPMFSPNGESVFIAQANTVMIFSAKTGELVSKFEPTKDKLVAIEFDINNQEYIVGCTESGKIVRWKCKKGTIEQKTELKLPQSTKVVAFSLISLDVDAGLKAIIIYRNQINEQFLEFFDVQTGVKSKSNFEFRLNKSKPILRVNQQFHYFVVVQHHMVFVVNFKTWQSKILTNAHKIPITCLEFHPKEEMLATGDTTGKIFLWRNLYADFPLTTLLHWHHTQVNALEFTESGSGLYSSGNESVLVRWGLTSGREEKAFLPRLPGIGVKLSFCNNDASLAVSLEDNSVLIIGSNQAIEATLQLSSLVPPNKTDLPKFPVGFKLNPRNQSVLYNGRKGQLQFVSTYTKSLMYNMDVVLQNRQSEETDKILYDIRVTAADIHIDWLATGEEFNDYEHSPEIRLKFWEYQKDTQNYSLNTNFELPHDSGFRLIKFSSALGSSDDLICVTVGLDNIIKVWALADSDNIYKPGKKWNCIKKISYRNQPIESVSFSSDGSLLAAGFSNNLCIYKTKTMELKFVLSAPATYSGVFNECFVKIQNQKSKKNYDSKSIFKNFVNSLESGDDKFINSLSSSKFKTLKTSDLNKKSKQTLHKEILNSSDLSFYQKLVTFKNLSIGSKVSNAKVSEKVVQRFSRKSINLSKKIKHVPKRSQFKAKYKLDRILPSNSTNCDEVASLLEFLNISKKNAKQGKIMNGLSNGNGIVDDGELETEKQTTIPKLSKKSVQIKHICFCSGEYAHLVVVCTENRVFIWNLLNLRLQNIMKLSVKHIAFDPITNLVACFSKYQELYVFLPNTPIPIYYRNNFPRIEGAIWVPRRYPQSQSLSVNWQAISTLYFVTSKQEFSYLAGREDSTDHVNPIVVNNEINSKGYSVFGALSTNKTSGVKSSFQQTSNFIGSNEKGAVQTVVDMSAHTMPPLKTFCNRFINSMIHIRSTTKSSKTSKSNSTTEVNGYSSDRLNDENDDDDDEDDNDSDVDGDARMTLHKTLSQKSESLETKPSTVKDEKLLRVISKAKVDLEF